MIERLRQDFPLLRLNEIEAGCRHSRSQLYKWRQATAERKKRDPKQLSEEVIGNAAAVVAEFPHLSGRKGQAHMLYHELGYISMKAYGIIKKQVKRILAQEVSGRKDIPKNAVYEHIRPEAVGEIWAEDFTEVRLWGISFKIALLIDVYSQYQLGCNLAHRATEELVAGPVHQAIKANGGQGPKLFMLQDNGKQYVSAKHGALLSAENIIQRCIPACKPQYNGAVECGGKEFKNVFYNVWERRERKGADKEKNLLTRARLTMMETVELLNETIPRPSLGGVTPSDVQNGRQAAEKMRIDQYLASELAKEKPPPLSRPYWDILKNNVEAEAMNTKELLTKMAFYFSRPLRRIAQINQEVWGN